MAGSLNLTISMRNAFSIPLKQALPPEAYLWTGGLLLTGVLCFLLLYGQLHLLVALVIGISIFTISRTDKLTAVILTMAYLFLMGDIRRIIALAAPQPAFDPLLLIGPVTATILALPLLFRLRLRDNLSKAMLALMVIMILEIANPAQGGLSVGLSGAFFYIVPVLWFWVGRSLASPSAVEQLLYRVLVPLAIAASILGLCQTFIGFPPYQKAWIDSALRVYTALYVGSSIRPFGFSISASEYATLLVLGALTAISAFLASRRPWILAFPLIAAALVLASGRGYILRFVVALSAVWVMRKGQRLNSSKLIGIGVLGVLSLVGVSLVASRLSTPEEPLPHRSTAAQDALSHQLGGLAHPFDARYSSAGTHGDMIASALTRGFTHPLGLGLGYSTFAAAKLSGNASDQGSSEVDLTDMFLALGVTGGAIYLIVAVLTLRGVLRYIETAPLQISLPVLSIVVATFGGWLIGPQYSTSSLLFFLLGALVYQENQGQTLAPLI